MTDDNEQNARDERILILAPTGRDASMTERFLHDAGLLSAVCAGIEDFRSKLSEGAGLIFLTEEALIPETIAPLIKALREQPPWSDVPIIVLTSGGENSANAESLAAISEAGNVTLIERPVRLATLLSALKSALRARHRQYDARDFLISETRTKEALTQSEERLRLALDAARLGAWQFDFDTLALECTDICKANLGLPPEADFSYEDFIAAVHPDDRENINSTLKNALGKQEEYKDEYRIVWRDNSLHWILVQGSAKYDQSGRAHRIAGVMLDITERKEAEKVREELLESEQKARAAAETANRLKDDFLATVSHELRTPLNAILGWTNLLSSGRLNAEDTSRALQTVRRNAKNQAEIIEDLLDVSRILSGKLNLQMKSIDPLELVKTAVESLKPAADAKKIRLAQTIENGVAPISGDAGRLQQVIWNLLSNAVKFTPEGGEIEIKVGRALDDENLEIVVRDTGSGIKPEFLPLVFDRFLQADGSTTRAHGGLGLGLAIVRHLVELHGGKVLAESEGEGRGATFTLKFPLAQTNDRNTETGTESLTDDKNGDDALDFEGRLAGVEVLVVDDEADNLELIKTFLERCGARVAAAKSMPEALARLEQSAPDVLISDIGMPEADGYELIRAVRRLPPERGGGVPAVALTAYARLEDKTRALESGFQKHLSKPMEFAELVATVADIAKYKQ
ncbi:MAG TPA: ATP-binding protein [Pyrinomonadaceae bacterium]|nr:ATP-binding protein [Pyrinomonadaceae bacterium]